MIVNSEYFVFMIKKIYSTIIYVTFLYSPEISDMVILIEKNKGFQNEHAMKLFLGMLTFSFAMAKSVTALSAFHLCYYYYYYYFNTKRKRSRFGHVHF